MVKGFESENTMKMLVPPLTEEKMNTIRKIMNSGFASMTQEQAVRRLGFSSATFVFLCTLWAFKP